MGLLASTGRGLFGSLASHFGSGVSHVYPLAAPPLALSAMLGLHRVFQGPLRQRLRQRRLLGSTRGLVYEEGGQVIHRRTPCLARLDHLLLIQM